jgi:hypothetical protein
MIMTSKSTLYQVLQSKHTEMANQDLTRKRPAEDDLLLAKRIRLNSHPDEPLSDPLDAVCYGMVSLTGCGSISSVFAKMES